MLSLGGSNEPPNLKIKKHYIYEEMNSSYTSCNSTRVMPFIHHRFLLNLRVRKTPSHAINAEY